MHCGYYWLRRCAVALTLLLAFSLVAWYVPRALDPTKASPERRARDRLWIDSSPYFLDRQLCRWVSLCGLHHLRKDPAALPDRSSAVDGDGDRPELRRRSDGPSPSWSDDGASASGAAARAGRKKNMRQRRRIIKDIPDYVLRHAPLVHLYSGEQFWPSDIGQHVEHMTVDVDNVPLNSTDSWTLHNLHHLNTHDGTVALHSRDDVESRPDWLHSRRNIPEPFPPGGDQPLSHPGGAPGPDFRTEPTTWFDVDKNHPLHRITVPPIRNRQDQRRLQRPPGEPRFSRRGHKPDADGYSRAPAVLIIVDKGDGIVDAFWFYFYSYNLGQQVLGIRFGNHVGDWEHSMVRFENGVPRGLYFSEHEGGQAYAWEAVEKRGDRPVIYSAVGSHAMYALPGDHPYILPFGLLKDVTDKGPLWDPSLNNYAYYYEHMREPADDASEADMSVDTAHSLVPAASNPKAPTSWFHYKGRWGDEVYALADPRQWRLFGQYHYVTGPTGPKFKRLDRSKLCRNSRCRVLHKLDPKGTWY